MSRSLLAGSSSWLGRCQAAVLLGSGLLPAFALIWLGMSTLTDPLLSGRFVSHRFSIPLSEGMTWARILAVAQVLSAAMVCLLWGRRRLPAVLAALVAALPLILVLSGPDRFRSFACGCYGSLMGEWLTKLPLAQIAISGSMSLLLIGHSLMLPTTPAKSLEQSVPEDSHL